MAKCLLRAASLCPPDGHDSTCDIFHPITLFLSHSWEAPRCCRRPPFAFLEWGHFMSFFGLSQSRLQQAALSDTDCQPSQASDSCCSNKCTFYCSGCDGSRRAWTSARLRTRRSRGGRRRSGGTHHRMMCDHEYRHEGLRLRFLQACASLHRPQSTDCDSLALFSPSLIFAHVLSPSEDALSSLVSSTFRSWHTHTNTHTHTHTHPALHTRTHTHTQASSSLQASSTFHLVLIELIEGRTHVLNMHALEIGKCQ